jgi:TRAP-type C4-dicarboxylate transport system permease small subunit
MGMTQVINTNRRTGLAGWILQVEGRLFWMEKWTCTLALATMVVTVFLTILVRNLNLPWPNFGEWALVSVIPLTFVGAAMCTYLGSHISVDALRLIGLRGVSTLSRVVTAVANMVFSGIFVYSGWFVFSEAVESGEQMLELGTPLAIPLAFIPVGMALMLFHSLIDLLAVFVNSLEREK